MLSIVKKVVITHNGETREATDATWSDVLNAMIAESGVPFGPGTVVRVVEEESDPTPAATPAENAARADGDSPYSSTPAPAPSGSALGNSEFGAGNQIVDDAAKARIEVMHDKLGIDASKLPIGTGTRMADVGYQTQAARKAEFDAEVPLQEAAAQLRGIIEAERRKQVTVTAGEFGKRLAINGALTFDGLKVREQALRGLIARLKTSETVKSGALTHVLTLRDRIADKSLDADLRKMDRDQLLDVLQRECERFSDADLMLRTREGLGDVFAIMSPGYGVADFPEVAPDVLAKMPAGAKGSFTYDPTSTAWELKANVWTPTPTQEQAVGEPFKGYASIFGKDNGTRKLGGGGGIWVLACLNAGVFEEAFGTTSRIHRKNVLVDLGALIDGAVKGIAVLCEAWGTARQAEVDTEVKVDGKLIPLDEVIPGFYRHMLTARKGELVGVLPGRREKHVEGLKAAYFDERRDAARVVRSDLANGYTKYIQQLPVGVQKDAERAIGRWVVSGEKVEFAS